MQHELTSALAVLGDLSNVGIAIVLLAAVAIIAIRALDDNQR